MPQDRTLYTALKTVESACHELRIWVKSHTKKGVTQSDFSFPL